MITEHYCINENTLALLPAKQIDYDTIVIETEQIIKVRKTSFELIEEACYNDWSTYEGKRQAVMRHTTFKRKVPIPIIIHKEIYFFPTHSPTSIHNKWISFQHIHTFQSDPNNSKKTAIVFTNGLNLSVNIPFHTIEKQMQRTFECKYRLQRAF